jgi:hypothetical protein
LCSSREIGVSIFFYLKGRKRADELFSYQVWPESKFAALGAFIFLRSVFHLSKPNGANILCSFISPAIVAPEIVDVAVPRDDGGVIRRGLMVIAKVMQNLANNIFFGKEAHMVCLNPFLTDNITNVTRYLSEVNVSPVILLRIPFA